MKLKKTIVAASAALALAGLGIGTAFAVWTVSGSGSGAGAATIAQSLTVTPVTPSGPGASLYPGGPAGQVYFQIANPNPFPVTVTGLSWGTPVSSNPTACPTSNVTVDANAPTTVSISVPANAPASTAYQINGVLDLAHSAPNGCQGVSFTVSVQITGAQQ